MPWTETERGFFERPLGENETFIKLTGDAGIPLNREHWTVNSEASFVPEGSIKSASPEQIEKWLRDAWKHLRFVQPSMAAHVIEGDNLRYEVPDPTALESWSKQTFVVVSDPKKTPSDVIADRKATSLAVLYYLPHNSQVVLSSSHWRTDGIGMMMILDVFFDLFCQYAAGTATSLTWGSEPANLALSVEEAADLTHEPSAEIKSIANKTAATFGHVANAVGIRYQGDTTTIPGGTRCQKLQFTPSQTTAIVSYCKNRDISVTSAVHASVTAANYAFAGNNSDKHFTSTIRFGLRPYIPEKHASHGAALCTSGYMFKVEPQSPWSDWANTYNQEYKKGYSTIMPAHREYACLVRDMVRNMPPPDPNEIPPSGLDMSSIGDVDKYIKPVHTAKSSSSVTQATSEDVVVEITNVTVGVEMLTRQMVCFVWSFRGQLNLQIVYNESFQKEESVLELLGYIKDTTLKELGVGVALC